MNREIFGLDSFSPREIAARIEAVGVVKARLPLMSMIMLVALVYHVIYRRGAGEGQP